MKWYTFVSDNLVGGNLSSYTNDGKGCLVFNLDCPFFTGTDTELPIKNTDGILFV